MAISRSAVRNKRVGSTNAPCRTRLIPLAACIRALVAGGLIVAPIAYAEPLPQVLPGGRWQGALDPHIANAGQDMIIRQIENRALLDWQSFDIDPGYGVRFDQPSSSAVALNRIHDNDRSVINGRLQANGQVYLINRNGIVFGNNAQVDVNTLIASTLNIEEEIFEQGILGAIQDGEAAFVAEADMPADALIEIRAGAQLNASQGTGGRIMILAPDILNAGDIRTPDGQAILAAARDRVYLAQSGDTELRGLLVEVNTGGDVRNVGSIVAERGNVSIMGLSVNQDGLVRATSTVSLNGSIRLVAGDNGGDAVDPFTKVDIKTQRARVKGEFFEERGGTLSLGGDSVTEVLPAGSARAADEQAQPGSFVDMAGKSVTLKSGARVTVTGGDVTILAGNIPRTDNGSTLDAPAADVGVRIESGAIIDVSGDASTVVPVSRNVVAVEARGNQLADSPLQRDGAIRNKTLYVDVRKGSPFLNFDLESQAVQRDVGERFSTGGTVQIDSTGDVVVEDGARIDIRGGKVTYTSDTVVTSKLVTEDGRVFDISEADPSRRYVGVLGADLEIEYAKWGITDVFRSGAGAFESGYSEGKDAGNLLINTRRLSFNGELIAGSEAGRLQRLAGSAAERATNRQRSFDQRPFGGQLSLDLSSTLGEGEFILGRDEDRRADPAHGEALADAASSVLSADMLRDSGVGKLVVDTTGRIRVDAPVSLPDNGAVSLSGGRVDVNNDIRIAGGAVDISVAKAPGDPVNGIVVPETEVELRVAAGVDIDVSGRWSNDSPRLNATLPSTPIVTDGGSIALVSGGDLTLETGSVLDVSAGAHLDAGGSLDSGAAGSIELSSSDNNSAKDPTRLTIEGELRGYAFEDGGSLALTANDVLIADQARVDALLRERLPDGNPRYTLGGTGPVRSLIDTGSARQQQIVLVDPDLFERGGFDSFDLTATRGGLGVADGTRIRLRARNQVLDTQALLGFAASNPQLLATASREGGNGNPLELVPAGTALDAFTHIAELPDPLRGAVDLSLTSENAFKLEITQQYPVLDIGTGAQILGDPGARIALTSDTSLFVDGRIDAPAGNIALELDTSFNRYAPQQMIWLGPQAQLSARGAAVLTPHELGFRQGVVLDAGAVALQANFGSIVTAAGSRIDVDGVSTTLDLATGAGGAIAPTVIAGRAGAIQLTAAESILLQGELSGRAARAGDLGGELSVTLDPTRRPNESEEDQPEDKYYESVISKRYPSGPRVINLAGLDAVLPARDAAIAADLNGQAFVSPDAVRDGGFDSLHLAAYAPGSTSQPDRAESLAMIRFTEDVNLTLNRSLTLDAPLLSTGDAAVQINAAYVALGSTDTRFRLDASAPIDGGGTLQTDPSGSDGGGNGRLRIEAELIDLVGDAATQGFGTVGNQPAVDLISHGDIRLRGTRIKGETEWQGSLRTGGDLRLQAQQVYPTTLSDFSLRVEAPVGSEGTLDIRGRSGTPGQPLSVGGRVTLDAEHIVVRDGARVRAPIGEIAFTGDNVDANNQAVGARSITLEAGSLLSTSAAGLSIPFGYTQFQKDLVLPIPGENKTVQFVAAPETAIEQALPQQSIRLSGDAIDVQPGAQFDLSGGGDIRATEFIPGPGGSRDILLADLDSGDGVEANGSFAILPRLGTEFAPFDPIESPAAETIQNLTIGQTLVLKEGIDGLPAGEYAILPARYALFGGYLVTPLSGTTYQQSGQNQSRLDGVRILTGQYAVAGSSSVDGRTLGFAIEDGTRVRLRAEYAENSLDSLFAGEAVRTPRDAGTLTVAAGDALRLAGTLAPTLTGGRGSAVDIVGDEIAILARPNGGSGNELPGGARIELLAGDLEGLNADSLLIGATRRLKEDGLAIDPRAARIDVAAGVDLDTRELILVADRLSIGSGTTSTRLSASGATTQPDNTLGDTLIVDGNASVAMVSAKRGATLTRNADASTAELTVASGVTLSAPGSLVLDANGDVTLDGMLDADGATLALGGASVSLGETDGRGLSGLVLSNADLARLTGSDLTLRSGSTLDLYGAVQNGAGSAHSFERLAIDAQGLVGRDNSGASARLAADALVLRNLSGAELNTTTAGDGQLLLQAEQVTLDSGSFAVQGYAQTRMSASGYVLTKNVGELNVMGGLTIDTPLLTAAGGAERRITTDAALTVAGGDAQAVLPAAAGLGARLTLEAATLDYTGNMVLPSGQVTLNADGAIALNNGARIDVAGRDVVFASKRVGTSGGAIRVESQNAGITVAAGTTLDVSGADAGGTAGRIELVASQGTLTLSPNAVLRANETGGDHGEFVVDAAQFTSTVAAENALTTLNELLQDDFQGRRELRVRRGDLVLEAGQVLRAREVKLVADGGRLAVDGGIDASGTDGGSIVLAAGDALDVNGTLDAHATAAGGDGGRVELAVIDADGDDLADGTRDDVVNLNTGSVIDVRGGANGDGGSVLVRGLAYDADANGVKESVAVGALDATLRGAARADVEAVHAVSDTDITTDDMNSWRGMLEQFMDTNTVALPASWRLVPGLEVTSTGDLTLSNAWDLYADVDDADPANDWRFGADNDVPGILTLRAAGSVRIDESLSDVFSDAIAMVNGIEVPYERLGVRESWRYRIVAGADATSADVLATTANANADLVLAANTSIRTGSGDIELASGGDIELGDGAAIYTAGHNSGFGPLGGEDVNLGMFMNFGEFDIIPGTGEEFLLTYLNKGQFPVEGGDIRIAASGDLRGQASQVRVTDWQPRVGGTYNKGANFENLPTHWAIAFERFTDGVGALGGGDITARVSGDVRDVALALPTTGKPEEIEILSNTDTELVFSADVPTPRVNGGGDLHLDVAGNLSGGAIQVDRGIGQVRVGGDLGDATAAQQTYFAIANTQLNVEARGALQLGGVFNSTALPQVGNLDTAQGIFSGHDGAYDPLFFTYTADAAAEITALTGDMSLSSPADYGGIAATLYPPTLKVRSLQGGISIGNATGGDVQTYPAPRGQLELLAEADIRHLAATNNNYLIQSDADSALFPSVTRILVPNNSDPASDPLNIFVRSYLTRPGENDTTDQGRNLHASTPVHQGDQQANLIVSRSGSIIGKVSPGDLWEWNLAKQTLVSAGVDIRDMSFRIQHTRDTDISVLSAGGSVVQSLSRNQDNGSFTASRKIIEIAGPGRLDVIAGADIDLGSSQGIVSIGDTVNPALADDGADIQLLAGAAEEPEYDDFIAAYLEDSALYLSALNAFLRERGVDAGGDPVAAFRDLSRNEQRELLFAILFEELKASGNAASQSANQDYSRGFTAIATLFPEAAHRADISTLVSVVKSVDKGNISMLAPYGDIDAGATFRAIEKNSDELGIIAGRGGDIGIFLDGDLRVNRERVFALQGDLLVWSSNGDIDAGKGAKKITSVPDPIITFDANGNTVVTFPPAVEGSGLNAVNAFLFAPRGAINAGDAGIRTSGNLTLGAVEVLGTDNIDVGGVSTGVPTAASVPVGVTDAGALANSTSLAEESTSSLGGEGDEQGPTLGLLSVELLGFGAKENCDQNDTACKKQ